MKPSADMLAEMAGEEAPDTEITITVEKAPDWKAMGKALLSAIKAGDEMATAQAVRAIAMCCDCGESEDGESED